MKILRATWSTETCEDRTDKSIVSTGCTPDTIKRKQAGGMRRLREDKKGSYGHWILAEKNKAYCGYWFLRGEELKSRERIRIVAMCCLRRSTPSTHIYTRDIPCSSKRSTSAPPIWCEECAKILTTLRYCPGTLSYICTTWYRVHATTGLQMQANRQPFDAS